MMQRMKTALEKSKNEKGFTLVEMALVLIIIGVIIGAIVKGKDLVRGADQKRIYSKFVNEWRLAYLNFYDRTGKLLGDFYDGSTGGQDGECDTDDGGDGSLDRANLTAGGTGYRGLSTVGLKTPVTNTANAYQYNYTDSQGNGHQILIAFRYDGTNNYNYMEITPIPNELAMALDTLIDGEANGATAGGDFINAAGTDWGSPTTAVTAHWKMQF